jgi:uncharacterized FlaG/YvyC family protein
MDTSVVNNANVNLLAFAQSASAGSVSSAVAEDRHTLIQAVHAVNAAGLYGEEQELSFVLDRNSHWAVVRIVNRKTRTVIQQIPNEQVLRLAEEVRQRG